MICTHCYKEVPDDVTHCYHCQTSLPTPPLPSGEEDARALARKYTDKWRRGDDQYAVEDAIYEALLELRQQKQEQDARIAHAYALNCFDPPDEELADAIAAAIKAK